MAEDRAPTTGPNLATLAGALMTAGWSVKFVARRLEARKGSGLLEVPRGEGGRHAPVVQCLDSRGGTVWGMVMTPGTPESIILATANAAAG